MRGGDADGRGRRLAASPSTPVGIIFVLAVALLVGALAGAWATVVYALSFWHYPIYALAFVCRQVRLEVFKRDAVLMKGVSLAVFAAVYLTQPPDLLSLSVVIVGLAFNISAARALGADRTYYGYELAAIPPKLVKSFPYSVLAHPMLTGNAVAFTGTLLNAEFRADWWPLAVAHALLNLAVLVMEARAEPKRLDRPKLLERYEWLASWPMTSGVIVAGTLIAGLAGGGALLAIGLAIAMLSLGLALLATYAWHQQNGRGPVRAGQQTSG